MEYGKLSRRLPQLEIRLREYHNERDPRIRDVDNVAEHWGWRYGQTASLDVLSKDDDDVICGRKMGGNETAGWCWVE